MYYVDCFMYYVDKKGLRIWSWIWKIVLITYTIYLAKSFPCSGIYKSNLPSGIF